MELSLYRKYRPQTFAEIAGQDHVSTTLQNAVRSNTVAHAYVFAGSRGTGKTSMAKILAKALNCTGPDPEHVVTEPTVTPCGVCDSCRAIAASTALDVIEMDAASNRGIDDIRELRDKVAYAPVQGRYKVYIVDEAHMLTKEAFNALLKTLEEPPAHVVFVLATTEVHKIPATILSRCQRFDFRRPRVHDIAMVIGQIAAAEHITIDEPAVLEIARHAEGGFRDAIGTLEKLSTYFGEAPISSREVLDALGVIATELLFEIVDVVIERDPAAALLFVQRLAEHGTSYPQFIHDLLRHLRQVFLVQYFSDVSDDRATLVALSQNLEIDEQLLDRLGQQASQLPGRELLRLIDLLGGAQTEIRAGLDPRLQLEMALVKAARPEVDHSPDALEERLRRLESGSVPIQSPPPRPAGAGAAAARAGGESVTARAASATKPNPAPAAQAPAAAAATTPAKDQTPEAPVGDAADEALPPTATAAQAATAAPAAVAEPAKAASDAPEETTAEPSETAAGAPEIAAETPDQQAAPAEAEPDGGAGRVKRAWQLVLQQAEAQNVTLYAAIKDARVHTEGEALVVTLPSSLTYGRASSPANRELLAAIIERTTGDAPELRYLQTDDQAAPSATPRAAEPDAGLSLAERIALAKRELDASEMPDDD